MTYEEDGAEKQIIIPLVIENKIYTGEGQNQTHRYYKAASEYELVKEVEHHPICVLLTVEDKKAQSEHFYNITYQDLLTYVIEPLATSVAPDSMQFVESFIRNLGRPALINNKYYGALHYAKILASLKIKNAISLTPLNCDRKAFTFALNDSADAFVDRLSK